MQETARKITKYSRNETIFKLGHHAKAIAFAKSSLWLQKFKLQKTCQTPFHKSFTMVLCKKPLEKKRNIPEMRPYCKMRPSCKGYSLCKTLTLAQKLKFQKTCKKPFYKSFRVLLCTECYSLCMMAEFGNCLISGIFRVFSSKFFLQDHSKRFVKSFRVVLCKKTARKNTKYSRNETIFKMGHHAKAIAFAKSSLWLKN